MKMHGNIRCISGIVTVGMTAVMVALSAGGCTKHSNAATGKNAMAGDTAAVKVVVSVVQERPFEAWGSFSADLRGAEDAVLTAPFQGGRVEMIKPVGTRFAAGDPLCAIDVEKYEAALEAAKAQVEVTKGDLDRAKMNVEKGALGKSAMDGANLMYQNARMALVTAKRAYEDCRCQAPFDGVLVSSMVERFQTVSPGMSTIRISRLDRLEAVIAIPETEAFSYTKGMKAVFRLLQHPDQEFDGEVATIDQAVDARSRTVAARVLVRNKNGLLRPGMIGRVQILRKRYDRAVVIPSTALLHLENGLSVMIARNGRAVQRAVLSGAATSDSTLVTNGLTAGDTLIVTGAFQVSDGTKIVY